jgi:hypothetical protein
VKKIDQIYELFRRNIRDAFTQYSLDVIVRFCEISVEVVVLIVRLLRGSTKRLK